MTQLNLSLSGELPAPISRIYYLASELASVIQVFDWTLIVSATKKSRDSSGVNARQVVCDTFFLFPSFENDIRVS